MKKTIVYFVLCLLLVFSVSCQSKDVKDDAVNNKQVIENRELDSKLLFKNLNARKAFAYALDKKYIIDVLLNDGSEISNYFVPKNTCFDENGNDFRNKYPNGWIEYNEEKAKEYWKKAKEELDFDIVKLEFLTYDIESRKKIAEYVQSQFTKTLDGVEIKLNIQPFKNKINLSLKGEFDLEFTGWGGSYPDPLSYMSCYLKDNTFNLSGWYDDYYTDNLNDCRIGVLANNKNERFEMMKELEKRMVGDEVAFIPLFQKGSASLKREGFKGFIEKPLRSQSFKNATTDVKTDEKDIIRMISASDLPTIDTIKANDTVSNDVIENIFDTLLEFDENNKLVPLACESYEKNEDGSKYIFNLRKNALWSNGDPVTAKDFEFAFKKIADPDSGAQYVDVLVTSGIKNAKKIVEDKLDFNNLGVNAIDDYTLEIELDYPNVLFETLMTLKTFCPINEKFYNEHKETYGTTVEDAVYNGPYKMDKWDIGYGYSFVKNDKYWNKDNVKNDGVNFRVIKEVSAGVNLYEKGEVDMCNLSGEFIENYIEHPEFNSYLDSGIMYIALNIGKH